MVGPYIYLSVLAIVVGLGLPIAVLSAAQAQAKSATAAMEGMARQPELAGDIRTSMILALAFIESLVIYALVMFFVMFGRLPGWTEISKVLGGG